VKKVKAYEMDFVAEPVKVRETDTIEEVLEIVRKWGHSKIPVTDIDNVFLGIFIHENYLNMADVGPSDPVTAAMIGYEDVPRVFDQENSLA